MSGAALGEADFRRYIAAFNRSEFAVMGEYYVPDIHFAGQGGQFHSREAVLDFYRLVKSRLRETVHVKDLIVGANDIAADLQTELYALEDWPDFPPGAIKKGETRRSENFVWYEIEGRQFARIRSARYRRDWDGSPEFPTGAVLAGRAVAGRADAGRADAGTPMTAARFADYIAAFNRDDVAAYGDFYDDDVVLVIAGKTELHGRQAIFDFYKDVKSKTDRTIEINRVIASAGHLAAELQSEFVARQDLPEFAAGPMKKGDRMFINTIVLYDLHHGKFARIRSARLLKKANHES